MKRLVSLLLVVVFCFSLTAFAAQAQQFSDVPADSYYYEPVNWAVSEKITSGTSDTTFSPNATCTRAQVVTFLWRAKGCPEPMSNSNKFQDVKKDAYYYTAVNWAVEQYVTTGTSNTTFSPNDTCTSAQIITFIWRALGQPMSWTSFIAPEERSLYYAGAYDWAMEKGILARSTIPFKVNNPAPRADVVTYLYYAINRIYE